jgi:type II secretory pathway component PulF
MLVFRGVLTYTEAMAMSIGEFQECWQAYADYLEQQERRRQNVKKR